MVVHGLFIVVHCFFLFFHRFFKDLDFKELEIHRYSLMDTLNEYHRFSCFFTVSHFVSIVSHSFHGFHNFQWFFQRTGFQRTGNPSIFIVGHHQWISMVSHQWISMDFHQWIHWWSINEYGLFFGFLSLGPSLGSIGPPLGPKGPVPPIANGGPNLGPSEKKKKVAVWRLWGGFDKRAGPLKGLFRQALDKPLGWSS